MLKIGDFSRLSRITIRMLRHYDDIGLLKPQTVDEWTGYRYYDEEQLLAANKIYLLKNLGFSLSEIKELLVSFGDYSEIERFLQVKKVEFTMQADNLKERILLIEGAITKLKQEGNFMNYVVNLKTIPELYVASVRKTIANYRAELELWDNVLIPEMIKQKCKDMIPYYPMSVNHDMEFTEQNADIEVRFAVIGKYTDTEDVKFKTIQAVEVASCMFKGDYDQILSVNEAIAKWVNENGYQFNGEAFWIYHKCIRETNNPDEFLTEVCFPVKKK